MSATEGIRGFSATNLPSVQRLPSARASFDKSQVADRIQGRIDSRLSSAGVDGETREALMADLSSEIQQQFSSGRAPNPAAIRETASEVFEQHGLNIDDFSPQRPSGLSGFAALEGLSAGSRLQSLQSFLDSAPTRNAIANPNEISNAVLDFLVGIDEEA